MSYLFKVSIIIPVYNAEPYIKQCLDSVVSQVIDPKEVIIIDDGSTDSTDNIIRKYADSYEYIRVFSQERQGAGAARNLAISKAQGEFVAFMDADDFYADENSLERLYVGAVTNKVKSSGGRFIFFKEGKLIKQGIKVVDATSFDRDEIIEYRNYQSFVGYQAFIYSREMLVKNKIQSGKKNGKV